MRPARRLCGVPCLCDHPHLCRQSSPRASPRVQTFLSFFFYSQANSISHPASGFCLLPFSPGWQGLFPADPARVLALLRVPEHHPALIPARLPAPAPDCNHGLCTLLPPALLEVPRGAGGCSLGLPAARSHAGLGQRRAGTEGKGPPRTLYRGVSLLMSLRATSIPITPRMSWFWKEVQGGRRVGAGLSPATASTGTGKHGGGLLLPPGMCGLDLDTAGAQGRTCHPPGSPPWDTAPLRDLQLPADPTEPGGLAKAVVGMAVTPGLTSGSGCRAGRAPGC